MAEQDSYQKFLERIEDDSGIIDPYTIHTLASLAAAGHDVNNFSVPMLALAQKVRSRRSE